MSIQDPGTNTSWEQELPKVVRDLGFLGIVQDCHVSFLFSPFHTPVPFPYFVLFFEFPKCHLSAFELTAVLGAELKANRSRCGLCMGFGSKKRWF